MGVRVPPFAPIAYRLRLFLLYLWLRLGCGRLRRQFGVEPIHESRILLQGVGVHASGYHDGSVPHLLRNVGQRRTGIQKQTPIGCGSDPESECECLRSIGIRPGRECCAASASDWRNFPAPPLRSFLRMGQRDVTGNRFFGFVRNYS